MVLFWTRSSSTCYRYKNKKVFCYLLYKVLKAVRLSKYHFILFTVLMKDWRKSVMFIMRVFSAVFRQKRATRGESNVLVMCKSWASFFFRNYINFVYDRENLIRKSIFNYIQHCVSMFFPLQHISGNNDIKQGSRAIPYTIFIDNWIAIWIFYYAQNVFELFYGINHVSVGKSGELWVCVWEAVKSKCSRSFAERR